MGMQYVVGHDIEQAYIVVPLINTVLMLIEVH